MTMEKQKIDIPLDGGGQARRRPIDIPLDGDTDAAITRKEFEAVNRHHEAYKEMRRRAQEEGKD